MVWQTTLLLMTGILSSAGPADLDGETMKIQGTWILISTERDGKVLDPGASKGRDVRWVFEADQFIAREGEKEVSLGTFKLDVSRTPRWYDRTYTDGTPRLGIYRLDGDTLTICLANLGKDRPSAFRTTPGDGLSLLVYQREKP